MLLKIVCVRHYWDTGSADERVRTEVERDPGSESCFEYPEEDSCYQQPGEVESR